MTDPIYKYVKGEGWVLENVEQFEFTDEMGNRVRLERRPPDLTNENERGWWWSGELEEAARDILDDDSYPYGWLVSDWDIERIKQGQPILTVINIAGVVVVRTRP
jgi:hypothetical protein